MDAINPGPAYIQFMLFTYAYAAREEEEAQPDSLFGAQGQTQLISARRQPTTFSVCVWVCGCVNGDMQGRKRRKYQYTAFDLVKRCYGIHHRYLSSVGLSDPAMCLCDKLYSQLPWTPALSSSPSSPSKRSLFPQL